MSDLLEVVEFAIFVLNLWATARIIGQAGYSRLWILLPLVSFVLTFAAIVTFSHDLLLILLGESQGLGTAEGLWVFAGLSWAATWVFFLVFAFSRWPVTSLAGARGHEGPRPEPPASPWTSRPGPTYRPQLPAVTKPRDAASPSGDLAENVPPAPAVVAPSPTSGPASVRHCAWCGEPLPGNRAFFHECGSRDRPATHCVTCGAALPNDGAPCATCAVPS